jgi:hypothetical protein
MYSSESRNRTSVGHLLPAGEGKDLGGATTPPHDVFPLRGERVAAMRRRVRGPDHDVFYLLIVIPGDVEPLLPPRQSRGIPQRIGKHDRATCFMMAPRYHGRLVHLFCVARRFPLW